jgi:hypothetical protein
MKAVLAPSNQTPECRVVVEWLHLHVEQREQRSAPSSFLELGKGWRGRLQEVKCREEVVLGLQRRA